MCRRHYVEAGLGAEYIDQFVRWRRARRPRRAQPGAV